MHIINQNLAMHNFSIKGCLLVSIGLLTLSSVTHVDAANQQVDVHLTTYPMHAKTIALEQHKEEHGGQIYQTTKLESAWLIDENSQGNLESKFETLVGTDENRLYFEANVDKAESEDSKYDISALYSRNIAPFWDAQAGIRYSDDKANPDNGRVDAVMGVMGLAPYFFETQAYLYAGENNFWSASLELERDLLLTQNLVTQPYIEADMVFNDGANYALKTGLSELRIGIKTRYEISKKFRPFIDVAYQYEKGHKALSLQSALQSVIGLTTESEKNWIYGVGVELMF